MRGGFKVGDELTYNPNLMGVVALYRVSRWVAYPMTNLVEITRLSPNAGTGMRKQYPFREDQFLLSVKRGEIVFVQNVVPGVGPESPTVTNAAGGRQSKVSYRLDLIPPGVLLAVGRVLAEGYEKYGPPTDGVENWRKIPAGDHLNRVMVHVAAYNAGDRSDDHLTHALCRLFFAAAMDGTRVTETTA